ncbi:MAG: c-type cytochrome [Planctomycetes bacterium]|nr:c-type cytochrome [Planctomycetota bacterium]
MTIHRLFPTLFLVLASSLLFLACGDADEGGAGRSQAEIDALRGKPGGLSLAEIKASLAEPGAHESFVPEAPFGITSKLAELIPADNPMTPAKVRLGAQLYFDPRLSKDDSVSCATCHHPDKGWTDNAPVSTGIAGQKGGRSAPTVMNRILHPTQFWDGRAASIEEQALGPIGNPIEMGFSAEDAATKVNAIEGYRIQFERVFGGPATADAIAKAIACFERTVITAGAPNDYYAAAKPWIGYEPSESEKKNEKLMARRDKALAELKAHPISEAAIRGRELFFGKAECSLCHVGENFSDELYWNLGIGMDQEKPDHGREDFTKEEKDRGKFRTPTLRNIHLTAPYMHDGSLKTLTEVVQHYNKGGTPNPWLSTDRIRPLKLSDQEVADVVTYMREALASPQPAIEIPLLP